MSICEFDTFEDEAELSMLIRKLQEQNKEFLQEKDPLDLPPLLK